MRTVAFQTPPGWQPPQVWQPPPQFPADSSRVLVYHAAARAVGKVISAAVTLFIVVTVVGVGIFLTQREAQVQSGVEDTLRAAQAAISAAADQARLGGQVPQAQVERLFEGAAAANVRTKLTERLGGSVRALEFLIYPEYVIVEAQDIEKPKHVDRYTYRNGALGDPDPVNVQRYRGKLDSHLFDLDDLALELVPMLVETTMRRLEYEDAKVTHIVIQRNLPFSKDVVIRVYAHGPRESGRVEFTADGKFKRVYR
jgi:hypothetical protein